MHRRLPMHPANPTFRKYADYAGPGSLGPWRDEMRRWLDLITRGIDPRVEQERQRAAALRAQRGTFEMVWGEFFGRHVSKLSHIREAERAGAAFRKLWGARPASEIEASEISIYIRNLAAETPGEARNRLGWLNRCYSWAIGTAEFGLTANPCALIKPVDLIGRKVVRDRVLTDAELRAVWSACGQLHYPYEHLIRLLVLTGQRLMECGGAVWSEIDLERTLWVIPATRMKMERAHTVPLLPDTAALLRSLPRFTGPYLFTTTDGAKPVNGFAKAKRRLDELSGVRDWTLHDIRRTVRTHFSALPAQDLVRELVIAHSKPGLHRVYDLHAYEDEKRDLLERWEARLRGILAPKPPAEVADLELARARRFA
jgi:integrase